jgi:GNAT superfamily N-acetyltransferase
MTDLLQVATDNAATMWLRLAAARGYETHLGSGFTAVTGRDRVGRRILTRSPSPDRAAVRELVSDWTGPLVIEDSYSTVPVPDLTTELTARQMPVMVRHDRRPVTPLHLPVRRVRSEVDLRLAERLIVTGFTLGAFQPYQDGAAFPSSMLDDEAVAFFVVERDGEPAGACLTVTDDRATGFYWVTTMPEHRSHGVGRALMHGAIADLDADTITLTASKAGQPLYESMDFDVVGLSSWWS